MFTGDGPREVASQRCQELAKTIGLNSGTVRITISAGKAVKIEAQQRLQACCVERRSNSWTSAVAHELDLDLAPPFVNQHLESLIVSMIGRFGYLEARLEDGEVDELLLNSCLGSSRRRRPAKRRPRASHRR